ncbi:MAG: hypothetical protein ACJ8DJ_22615, partial [Gemmatimonadales bacterium]
LVMWIPAGLGYLLAALWLARAWLTESDRRVRRWESAIRSLGLLLLAWGAGALTSCGESAEQKAQKTAEQVASWRETAALTRAARARGAVPDAYARQMLDAVDLELRKLR